MKSIFTSKILKCLVCTMIIVQGFLFAIVATFYMDSAYFNKMDSHPSSGIHVTLKSIPEERTYDTYKFLKEYADGHGLVYIRKDFSLDKDGHVTGAIYSVDGDLLNNENALTFDFLGENVTNYEKLKKLLNSHDTEATLGIQDTSLHSLDVVPSFKYGRNVVFRKLESVVTESKTINGEYRIVGLKASQKGVFFSALSTASGVDSQVFLDEKSGYIIDNSFKEMVVVGVFVLHTLVLLALLTVITIRYLPNLGKLLIQGWSRSLFAVKLYRPMLLSGLISILLFIVYGLVLTEMTFHSTLFFGVMLALGLLNFFVILVLLAMSSLFIFLVSPINAIRERFPRKAYMSTALAVYIISSILIVAAGSYIDGPYREVKANIEISDKWKEVSEYEILRKISVGKDQVSINRQSKELFRDFYDWYKSISDNEDVNLVNTSFISKDLLSSYKANHVYESVPNEDFWMFTVSPNYLAKMGIEVDKEVIDRAKSGVRVYLIPEDKTSEERVLLQDMMKEKDTRSIRGDDITTVFTEKQEFEFVTYRSNIEVFSWNAKILSHLQIRNPVVLICTPNNMIYKESESLIAVGLDNSYVKLEGDASEKYLSLDYLSRFNLDDNEVEFATVKLFVDGLQKDLWTSIQLFFGMLIAITFIVVILLITILTIFQNSYKEKISIKKFLGFSNAQIYRLPLSIIFITIALSVLSAVLLKTKIGILYVSTIGIIQLVLFYLVMTANQMKKINIFLKS